MLVIIDIVVEAVVINVVLTRSKLHTFGMEKGIEESVSTLFNGTE